MGFKLNKKQEEAILKALEWYYMKSTDKPLFILAGLAGSGKSSTIHSIVNALGIMNNNILFTSLTGKAVSVLRMKGHIANTIHKSFYNAKPYKNTVYFNKKTTIPSFIQLIIIDEFGMVGNNMIDDILSFNVPILCMGDPCQLAPIFDKNDYMTEETADVFLDEVMRTDDKSGILDLAMKSRNKEILKAGKYGDSRVLSEKKDIKPLTEYDKILCWTNKTRKYINKLVRDEKNLTEIYPQKDEKIVFLNNRYDKSIQYLGIDININNGMECIVLEDSKIINDVHVEIKAKPTFMLDSDEFFTVNCCRMIFDSYVTYTHDTKTIMLMDRENNNDSIFCDYAYAITTTSSQGSEWGDILVIDEFERWRNDYFKYMYTAITRAMRSVDVLLNQ